MFPTLVSEHLLRRPSLFAIVALWSGILSARALPLDVAVILALAGCLAGACAVTPGRKRMVAVLAACLFLVGVLRSPEFMAARRERTGRVPVVLRLRLPFLTGQCEENVRARVEEVIAGDSRLLGGHVIARGLDLAARAGQRYMLVSGSFSAPQPARNFMAYSAVARSRREGVAGSVSVREVLEDRRLPADRALAGLRRSVRSLIRAVPEKRARGILEAILLGARGDLSPEVRSAMVRAGAYHVLAISGLHVGILVFMISILVTVLRLGRTRRVAASLAIVAFYVVFTGMRPSAMRAGTFFLVLSVARLFQYKVDYSNAVCFAGAALLVLSPALAWDLGFRLSFGAVFGMTLLLPAITAPLERSASRFMKVRSFVEVGLLASFSAQALTVPMILWSFGRVSIIAGVANLVVLPVMSLALTAGIEGAVFAAIFPGLGSIFMRSASVLAVAGVSIAEALGRCVNPLVYAGRPHAAQVAIYYAVVLWLGLFERRLGRRAKLALLAAAFAFMLVRMPNFTGGPGELELTFLYVGNGDACVMEVPGGGTWLVDTGPASADYDAAAAVVLPFLALRGIGSLEGLVVTHSHNDHYGGIPALIENIEVGEILVGTTEGEEAYRADLDHAMRAGVPVRCARAGEVWERGGVRFEVLHPGVAGGPGLDVSAIAGEKDDPNAWSMVIKVTFGQCAVLMTGDLTPAVQDSLVALGVDLSCDVLKVPHHGHPGETSADFAAALGARFAVISCGTKYFDEPDSTTTALLESAGMRVFSTRTDGAVRMSTDGRNLSISAVLERLQNSAQ